MKSLIKYLDTLTTFRVVHIILAIGLITFANALFNPFVWDDNAYILQNSLTHTFNFFSFFGNNIFNNSGQYRPFTLAYFTILYHLFGNMQFFYHLTQIVLHVVNACLLFIVFKKFLDKRLAFFLVIIFLIHPMQVESVSYISASGGALSFFFGMIALLIVGRERKKITLLVLQSLFLLSAILVKETGVLFLPVTIFYQWVLKYKNIKNSIFYSIIVLVIYSVIRIGIGNIFLADRPLIPIARLSFAERLITIPQVVFYYIKTVFYPSSLAIDQQWTITKITLQNFYLPLFFDLIFFSAIFLFGIFLYKKHIKNFKPYLFFCLWFIPGLTLHSQIIPLDMTVADRWFYFDIAGLLGATGIVLQYFLFRFRTNWKTAITIVGLIIIALFATRTIIRNNDWNEHTKLYTHDIAISDNFLIQEEYTLDLVRDGNLQAAVVPAKKSIEYFPHEENLYNLGYIYEQQRDLHQAKIYYAKALQAANYTPGELHHNVTIYIRLANILVYTDSPTIAKKFIESALNYYPNSDRLWLLLGLSEYKLQNHDAALSAVTHAYQLSPTSQMNNTVYQKLLNNEPIDIIFNN